MSSLSLFSLYLYPAAVDKGIKRLTLKRNKVPKKRYRIESERKKEGAVRFGGTLLSSQQQLTIAAAALGGGAPVNPAAAALWRQSDIQQVRDNPFSASF